MEISPLAIVIVIQYLKLQHSELNFLSQPILKVVFTNFYNCYFLIVIQKVNQLLKCRNIQLSIQHFLNIVHIFL